MTYCLHWHTCISQSSFLLLQVEPDRIYTISCNRVFGWRSTEMSAVGITYDSTSFRCCGLWKCWTLNKGQYKWGIYCGKKKKSTIMSYHFLIESDWMLTNMLNSATLFLCMYQVDHKLWRFLIVEGCSFELWWKLVWLSIIPYLLIFTYIL